MTLREIGLDNKREEPLVCLHLQNRRVVITEMVIRPLPEIRVRFGGDGNRIAFYLAFRRFSCPFKTAQVNSVIAGQSRLYFVCIFHLFNLFLVACGK